MYTQMYVCMYDITICLCSFSGLIDKRSCQYVAFGYRWSYSVRHYKIVVWFLHEPQKKVGFC